MKLSVLPLCFIALFSSATYAYTIECRQDNTQIQIFSKGSYEHKVQIIQAGTLIGSQGQVFCGPSTKNSRTERLEGGSCSSHLTVGGDARYRQPADFNISFVYVTGHAPTRGSGRAVAKIKATFRNQKTSRTETITLNNVACSVTN